MFALSTSSVRAVAISAALKYRSASYSSSAPKPAVMFEPLIVASPSRASKTTVGMPASRIASAPGIRRPS